MKDWIKFYYSEDDISGCACGCHDRDDHDALDSDPLLQIENPETGEVFNFLIVDAFELEDESYLVLVDDADDADEYFIVRSEEDENGEAFVVTLDESEADPIYEAYDLILDEYFEDEDFDEDSDEHGDEE